MMERGDAEALFGSIRASLRSAASVIGTLVEQITTAIDGEAWKAAGYTSWIECRDAEFGPLISELDKAQKTELVAALNGARLSRRDIEAATGISKSSADRMLNSVSQTENDNPRSGLETSSGSGTLGGFNGRHNEDGPGWSKHGDRWTPNAFRPEPKLPEPTFDDEPPLFDQPLAPEPTEPKPEPVMLPLRTHDGREVLYPLPKTPSTFNQTDGDGISWAKWSWNPVTGCLHGCDYCYARAIAARWADAYPAGFTPLFHHERLGAPARTVIPQAYRDDPEWRRVFVCSMADLYGRWVPDEWIKQVHESMLASPQWQYILLTKFPDRYVGLDMPDGAWVGTSVDEQRRVRIAERAFSQLDGVAVKWLSLEPLREPLEFSDLSMFDWIVIGAQTRTVQPDGIAVPEFQPEPRWVTRILHQAAEAGIDVHIKPNMTRFRAWLDSYPN